MTQDNSNRQRILAYLERGCSDWEISCRTGWTIEAVRSELAALQPGGAGTPPEGYLTLPSAAQRIGVDWRTLQSACRWGKVPSIRLPVPRMAWGGRVASHFVRIEAVLRWRNRRIAVRKNRKLRQRLFRKG